MEQLISVLVFAICAAVCVRIFAASYVMSGDAKDLSNALIIAKSGAECYKSFSGDTEGVARILGGTAHTSGTNKSVIVYYGKDRRPCGENEAVYTLSIVQGIGQGELETLITGDLSVTDKAGGDEILAFEVASRRAPK